MDFQTPDHICHYMVSLLPNYTVTVLEPTPGQGNLVAALKDYQVTAPRYFGLNNNKHRFDAVVMNPPFSPMTLGYSILYSVMEMSDVVIALMPWLTIINSEKRTRKVKEYGLKSVTHLPRSVFPGSRVQTCVLEMRKDYVWETAFQFYGL